jgi:hypothetical protein
LKQHVRPLPFFLAFHHSHRTLDAAAEYGALGLMAGTARILERLDAIEARQIAMEGRQTAMENSLAINNAMIHNQRVIARNCLSQPNCQPLQKTVDFPQFSNYYLLTSFSRLRAMVWSLLRLSLEGTNKGL